MPRSFAVGLMVLAILAGLALIFVAWPGTMGPGPITPLDVVAWQVMAAMAGQSEALIVVGVASLTAGAILVDTVWLSRQATDEQPT
jgi:hypothetical protein